MTRYRVYETEDEDNQGTLVKCFGDEDLARQEYYYFIGLMVDKYGIMGHWNVVLADYEETALDLSDSVIMEFDSSTLRELIGG